MREIKDSEFFRLVDYIKARYGIDLTHKRILVAGRLTNTLAEMGFDSFSDYFNYVISDPTGNAAIKMINILTTNHTYFAREMEHFTFFRDKVLPEFVARESASKDLRVWSAGCSSGEEPYTLAMVIDSYFGLTKGSWDTKILATDISTKVLAKAQKAVYRNEQLSSLPKGWQAAYFSRLNQECSAVKKHIQQEVIFRRFNLMSDFFPFKKKFHVIFCRNVMIYFDNKTRQELVNKYYEHTERGGYLFVGLSESLDRGTTRYKYIMPSVYRKE